MKLLVDGRVTACAGTFRSDLRSVKAMRHGRIFMRAKSGQCNADERVEQSHAEALKSFNRLQIPAWLCTMRLCSQVVLPSEVRKAPACLTGSNTITNNCRPRTETHIKRSVGCTTQGPIHCHRSVIQTEASLNASSYLSHALLLTHLHWCSSSVATGNLQPKNMPWGRPWTEVARGLRSFAFCRMTCA